MTVSKRNRIIYWVATLWLALGMTSTGIVQLIKTEEEVVRMTFLGYPEYLLLVIGIWKLLGVVAILIPKFPILKEWAYAGFFFNMTGAIISHLMMNDPFAEIFPALLLLILTMVSWFFRPEERKIVLSNQ